MHNCIVLPIAFLFDVHGGNCRTPNYPLSLERASKQVSATVPVAVGMSAIAPY